MRANRVARLAKDARAQVGIGTMIVFIATILVAATAAALLISTSGKLQERASRTGNEATADVSSNLLVKAVYGTRPAATGDLEDLNVTVALAPGATPVDLLQTRIQLSDGQKLVTLTFNATHGDDTFVGSVVRDPKGTFSAANPVLSAGTLVDLQIDLNRADAGGGMLLAARQEMHLVLIPEVGGHVTLWLTAPPSFGTETVVQLR